MGVPRDEESENGQESNQYRFHNPNTSLRSRNNQNNNSISTVAQNTGGSRSLSNGNIQRSSSPSDHRQEPITESSLYYSVEFDHRPETDTENQENQPLHARAYSQRNNDDNIWIDHTHRFQIRDVIDVLDSSGHWCEGEIMKIDHQEQRIYVSYLYWDKKFDEWVSNIEDKTAPLHTHTYFEGGPFQIGQRVEAMDEYQKWIQAYIINMSDHSVTVHFHGFHSKYDRVIDLPGGMNLIRPFGKYSENNARKYPKNKLWRVPVTVPPSGVYEEQKSTDGPNTSSYIQPIANIKDNSVSYERTRQIQQFSSQYGHYTGALAVERLRVIPVLGDGNCLFRSVAHQIYGDDGLHWLIRQRCMDYMEADADFFSQFIEGGRDSFPLYLRAKRTNACWGDDPEIQAISEIYYRPAEIWSYDPVNGARKLRTFHEAAQSESLRVAGSHSRPAIRLSYYGGGHYDSIIDEQFEFNIVRNRPGELEDVALNRVKQRTAPARVSLLPPIPGATSRAPDSNRTEQETLNYTIDMSRRDLSWVEEDIQSSLALSLEEECHSMGFDKATVDSTVASGGSAYDIIATQKEILTQVAETSENEFIEKAIISSICSVNGHMSMDVDENVFDDASEDPELAAALNLSKLPDAEVYEDPDLAAALNLSKLSEDEVLELAIKESMNQGDNRDLGFHRGVFDRRPEAVAYSSSSTSTGSNTRMVDSFANEDEMLRAALAASMADSYAPHSQESLPYDPFFINDDDEDISRAIAESLAKR